MAYGFRTDAEQLTFLQRRIERLEKTLERLEMLAVTTLSTGGNTKNFRQQEDIRMELERAEREYLIINSRMQGEPCNPHFKEMVICKRPQY